MNHMTEAPQGMGFRAQIRELLSNETVSIVPVTERNIKRFDKTLTELSQKSTAEGDMFPVTGNPNETNEEWAKGVKALWLIGAKETDFSVPENVAGFVNVYVPEQTGTINDWLLKKGMRAYEPGMLVEIASFVKDNNTAAELSANKQALAKVFMDDAFKDVRAVTTWVTHTAENTLDPQELADMKKLGGWPLGSAKYNAGEAVDSTCFLITRRQFMDALTGTKR
jgi:hypothetical protein